MPDTRLDSGSNRTSPRQLLTAVTKAPRRLLITGLTSLLALAGAVALVAAPAAANASTLPPPSGNLPGCILPAGVTWQLVVFIPPDEMPYSRSGSTWKASGDGHTYAGHVRYYNAAPNIAVAAGLGSLTSCNELS